MGGKLDAYQLLEGSVGVIDSAAHSKNVMRVRGNGGRAAGIKNLLRSFAGAVRIRESDFGGVRGVLANVQVAALRLANLWRPLQRGVIALLLH